MQRQNVVFTPNAWEKGNRGLRLNATLYMTFAWLASSVRNPGANRTQVRWLEGERINHKAQQIAAMQ